MRKNIKILIVEDEVLIGKLLKMQLEHAGYTICGPAISGEEAIKSAGKEAPDVILMDIRLMGEMDGIEAAKHIRTFSSAILIFTTGYQDVSQRDRAMELNPAAYMIKPVVATDVEAVVRSVIEP